MIYTVIDLESLKNKISEDPNLALQFIQNNLIECHLDKTNDQIARLKRTISDLPDKSYISEAHKVEILDLCDKITYKIEKKLDLSSILSKIIILKAYLTLWNYLEDVLEQDNDNDWLFYMSKIYNELCKELKPLLPDLDLDDLDATELLYELRQQLKLKAS